MGWPRHVVRLFLFVVALASCAVAQELQLVNSIDLTNTVGIPGQFTGIAFLSDTLLVVSNGNGSPTSIIYDIVRKSVIGRGTTCAMSGRELWSTLKGQLLAACPEGLVLYNLEFQPVAKFPESLKFKRRQVLLLSPSREFVSLNPLPRHGSARVLATNTLLEVATFPSEPMWVYGLFKERYLVYRAGRPANGGDFLSYRFSGLHPISLLSSGQSCVAGFGISETEFLKVGCGKQPDGEVVDIATSAVLRRVADTDSADFVQTASSGKRFALGFLEYSKSHVVSQTANPLTYLKALGTCCDDPANQFRLRIYDSQSGRKLAEIHWKMEKSEPMWERYDNSAVSLSPSGDYIAFLRHKVLEVYRVPQ